MIGGGPRLVHVTTTDMSLALLLGPQLEAYAAAGYEVVGAAAPGRYVDRLEAMGVTFVALRHATRAMNPLADVRLLGELVAVFRRLRPDIVHTHNPKPGIYGRVAAAVARVPAIVHTTHGLYAQRTDPLRRRAPVYALERLASTCSHAELVQNPEDLETLARLGVPRAKLRHLGNGVDLARFDPSTGDEARRAATRASLGVAPDDVLVLAVGRLVWEKGYRELFAAASSLRRTTPAVRFVVVGPDEPDKGDALGAGDRASAEADGVRFAGYADRVEDYYEAADVYVLASHREGFPRSAMEAAASALPVVATDIRGCREVVDHGRTGFLVPVADAAALARVIDRLAADAALRTRMGGAARHKATAEFDQQRVVDRTLETYDRLRMAR